MSNAKANNLLARGKGVNGWVSGYYLPCDPQGGEGASIYFFPEESTFESVCYEVDPETVTACSGMPSADGALIYDQDIVVNVKSGVSGIVEYSEDDGQFAVMAKDGGLYSFADLPSTDFRIAGNGFDNPEFLEIV